MAATAYQIADNRTHEVAEWNEAELTTLLEVLREEDALGGVGYTEDDLDVTDQTFDFFVLTRRGLIERQPPRHATGSSSRIAPIVQMGSKPR